MNADDASRLASLIAAEERAFALLAAIEASGAIAPGRSEGEVDDDIAKIAARDFGIERNWHKPLVRAGLNTLCVFADTPPERVIGENDTVYLDPGPVFEDWEADVGRTYAVGDEPARRALIVALPDVFEEIRAHANAARHHRRGALQFRLRRRGATQLHFRRQDRRPHSRRVSPSHLA